MINDNKITTDMLCGEFGFRSDNESKRLAWKLANLLKPEYYRNVVFYPSYNNLYSADIVPPGKLKESLEKLKVYKKDGISLYFALPWCRNRCKYCHYTCNLTTGHNPLPNQNNYLERYNEIKSYIDSLFEEYNLYKDFIPSIKSIYCGGGTPGLLYEFRDPENGSNNSNLLDYFLNNLKNVIKEKGKYLQEINFEIHPSDKHEDIYALLKNMLRSCSVQLKNLRISIGYQSFLPERREQIRCVKEKDGEDRPEVARKFFTEKMQSDKIKLNIDIMWGLSEKKGVSKDVKEELNEIAKIKAEDRPTSLTFYQIQAPGDVERHKIYVEEIEKDISEIVIQRKNIAEALKAEGYVAVLYPTYFVKNSNNEKNHFQAFVYNSSQLSKDCYYIGLGLAGHSKLPDVAYTNEQDLKEYQNQIKEKRFPLSNIAYLTEEDKIKRDTILSLKLKGMKLKKEEIDKLYKDKTEEDIILIQDAFFEKIEGSYTLNEKGVIYIDELLRYAITHDLSLLARHDKKEIFKYLKKSRDEKHDLRVDKILLYMKSSLMQMLMQESKINEFVANIAYKSTLTNLYIMNKEPLGLINHNKSWKKESEAFTKTLTPDTLLLLDELFSSQKEDDISMVYPLRIQGKHFADDVTGWEIILQILSSVTRDEHRLKKLKQFLQDSNKIKEAMAVNKLFQSYINEIEEFNHQPEDIDISFIISKSLANSMGGAILTIPHVNEKLTDIGHITDGVSRYLEEIFSLIAEDEYHEKVIDHAMRSAIAAIMSRNMSHNLGSHVLINLERNVNTEETDHNETAVFLKYLRSRMDFLAQVATGWPNWSLSMRFMNDIMANFLNQTHIFKYIGSSELLDEKKLIFHFDLNGKKFSPVDNSLINIISNLRGQLAQCDILVPIRGGTTGCHAIYTILENIIRNTAKYSYKEKSKKLEIWIQLNTESKEYIKFNIWDNFTKNNDWLLKKISEPLHSPIVDRDTGETVKSGWGLAEINISRAYLQNERSSLKKKLESTDDRIEVVERKDSKILQYSFKIYQKKEFALWDFRKTSTEYNEIKENGFYYSHMNFAEIQEAIDHAEHEFLVIFSDAEDVEKLLYEIIREREPDKDGRRQDNIEMLPYRLFIVGVMSEIHSQNPVIKKRICFLDAEQWNKIPNTNEGIENFKIKLYTDWIKHLRDNICGDMKLKEKPIDLYLGMRENTRPDNNTSCLKPTQFLKDNYNYLVPFDGNIENNNAFANWTKVVNADEYLRCVIGRFYFEDEIKDYESSPIITYPRHGLPPEIIDNNGGNRIYSENLSGNSPHFGLLSSPSRDPYQLKRLALCMIESALLRIAIADERLCKQLKGADGNVRSQLANESNIFILSSIRLGDAKVKIGPDPGYELTSENNTDSTEIISGIYDDLDCLIIHQGILDKLFDHDLNGQYCWIEQLKEKIPYIIITSGRGRPENVPLNAKYIPFSDIQQIFPSEREYHGKILLTAIMMSVNNQQQRRSYE